MGEGSAGGLLCGRVGGRSGSWGDGTASRGAARGKEGEEVALAVSIPAVQPTVSQRHLWVSTPKVLVRGFRVPWGGACLRLPANSATGREGGHGGGTDGC